MEHKKYQHAKDTSGDCAASGFSCEEQFKKLAESKGYEVLVAGRNLQFCHVDFILKKDDKQWNFECKSRKKIRRADLEPTDDYCWIEFKRTDGKDGWIFGDAHYVVLEQKDEFLIVDRKALLKLAEKLVDREKVVARAEKAFNVSYRRFGRKDEIAYILTAEIRKLKLSIWPKNSQTT